MNRRFLFGDDYEDSDGNVKRRLILIACLKTS